MKRLVNLFLMLLVLFSSLVGCSGVSNKAPGDRQEYSATFSIDCKTILDNMDMLATNKADIVPPNGMIMDSRTVVFYEGDSVFDILKRETSANKIHLEFALTPVHQSAYIEGIGNIYEFDCGNLSGWSYLVNGVSVGYSSNEYIPQDGDVIAWRYSCDLGKDIINDKE